MPCARCGGSLTLAERDPERNPCGCASLTELSDELSGTSLVQHLGCVADVVRDIKTALGAREYRVALVWVRWSGGSRGHGHDDVVHTETIMPTPKVSDVGALSQELKQIGLEEVGSVTVSEISPSYDEDVLMGLGGPVTGDEIPEDITFFWEITHVRSAGRTVKRRFFPSSAPSKDSTAFQWAIRLVRSSEDRSREGYLR